MTGTTGNGAQERQLIQNVLAAIEQRLSAAKQLGTPSSQNAEFIYRRFTEMVQDLEMAHDTIADLTELLYGSERNPVPAQLSMACRSQASGLQAVHLEIGGIPRTIMVEPKGCEDPIAEARLWRRLQERYGRGSR